MFLSITLLSLTNDVSPNKIERLIDEGKLPDPVTWNGAVGWHYDDLAAWLERARSAAPAPVSAAVATSSVVKRQAISPRLRFDVLMRDGFTCRYCGQRPPEVVLEVDHIVPVSAGGATELNNLQAACRTCNSGKSDRVLAGVIV